jgi:hypothetical protein
MKWFAANLGTIGMALLLAALTWLYLWNQTTATEELHFAFNPAVLAGEIAHVEYEDNRGVIWRPGQRTPPLKITGSRERIDALKVAARTCAPTFDGGYFTEMEKGSFPYPLRPADFRLPETGLRIEGGLPTLTLRYVKLVEMEVPLDIRVGEDRQGGIALGYYVEKITPTPPTITVAAPADMRQDLQARGLRIQPVLVTGLRQSFTAPGFIQPVPNVRQLKPFTLEVTIQKQPGTPHRIKDVPVHLAGPDEVLRKLRLESPTVVDLEVKGPETVLRSLTAADFYVYLRVDLKPSDIKEPRPVSQSNFRCELLRKVEGEIEITIMPDTPPQNREAKVIVIP